MQQSTDLSLKRGREDGMNEICGKQIGITDQLAARHPFLLTEVDVGLCDEPRLVIGV